MEQKKVRKIKKFKVNLRKREILRNFKLISQVKEITTQIEELVDAEIRRSADYVSHACVYSSFSPDEITVKFGPDFLGAAGSKMPVSATFIAATAGPAVEDEMKQRQERGETLHAGVIRALGLEACEAALNFIFKLAQEEARGEDCDVLPPEKLDGAKAAQVISALEAKKVGISIDDQNRIHPEFTVICLAKWK
jgi:hypothetical protein